MATLDLQGTGILELREENIERTCSLEFIEDPDFMLSCTNRTNHAIASFVKSLKALCQQNRPVWNIINDHNVSSQQIQVWIFYHLHYGLMAQANFFETERALFAAQVYFILLSQPGSGGSQFHHSIVYESSLKTFKMIANMNNRSKAKKKKSNIQEDEDEVVLSTDEQVSLLNTFSATMSDFHHLLSVYSLKDRFAEIKLTVEVLILVVKSFVQHSAIVSLSNSEEKTMNIPNQIAFECLRMIVNPKHGKVEELSSLVFRHLMTTITMRHSASSSGSLPRTAVHQAESAINLVTTIYQDHGENTANAIRKLMQNIIAQSPERAENRNHISCFVSSLIQKMPNSWFADFVGWLKRFASHTRIGYRVGALAVIGRLLVDPRRAPSSDEELTDEEGACLNQGFLLEIVVLAMSDVAPTVRASSLKALSDVMEKRSVTAAAFFESLQTSFDCGQFKPAESASLGGITPIVKINDPSLRTPDELCSVPAPSVFDFHPSGKTFLPLLHERASEEKYVVRKNAVVALEAALCNKYIAITKEALDILEERCLDPLLSIRKCAVQSLTNVLTCHPDNVDVQQAWMRCLLPAVFDAETSMQEKAIQLIEEKILSELVEGNKLSWDLLTFLTTDDGLRNRTYLQKVAKEWYRKGKLDCKIMNQLSKFLRMEKNKVKAWMLLSIFSLFNGDKKTADEVMFHLKQESSNETAVILQADMINTAGHLAKLITNEDQSYLLSNFKRRIEGGRCALPLISHIFEAIHKILEVQYPEFKEYQKALNDWCSKLFVASDNFLSDVVISPSQGGYDHALLVNHLYVVGEAAQRSFNRLPKRLVLSIQALLTSPSKQDESPELLSQPLSQFGDAGVPSDIRAHAIFNLGRVCFLDEALAKKCVPAFARELETCEHEEVRNNTLAVLADLCVLQTQLVDPFLQQMADCLGDESLIVRKHAIILLSSLLRKEYVKWKEGLLFKFLHAACDENDEVKSLARYFLLEQLLCGSHVAGNLFYRNFVACLFYYNAYEGHNIYKHSKTEREKKLFNLSGNFAKRTEIYEFMLINFEDQHRINLTGKLCTDVLEAFVEGTIPLNKETENLLTDTLSVLCCKDIRLRCLRTREESEIDEELLANNPDEQLKMVQNVAKHKVIAQTVKMNLVENIMPIVIALKNMLADAKSPLLKNVMFYLKDVMKEYRKEVQVILSADKQLASEIEFDLKRFEREQETAQAALLQKDDAPVVPFPHTPIGKPVSSRGFVTPATVKRRGRPMNVQAIIKSAQKALRNSPLRPQEEKENVPVDRLSADVPGTPAPANQINSRAASTPQSVKDVNVTFAARDISAIAGSPSQKEAQMLLLTLPEKTPLAKPWNVQSPARLQTKTARKSFEAQ